MEALFNPNKQEWTFCKSNIDNKYIIKFWENYGFYNYSGIGILSTIKTG